MIVNAISQLGAPPPDNNRARETAGASRTRKFMSIRATHGAAYNATIVDEVEPDDSSPSASRRATTTADDPPMDSVEQVQYVFAAASGSVSRPVRTLADAEDAYASN